MKKFMTMLAIALMATTTVFAQSAIELGRQQMELKEFQMKSLKMKPTKESKKQAKDYIKEGWKVNAGDRSMEQQITYGNLLAEEYMNDGNGNTVKRFIQQQGRSTQGTYNMAQAAARTNAQLSLAAMIKTKLAATMEYSLAGAQTSAETAATLEKFNQNAKAIVDESLTNCIPVLTIYRVLDNKNFEIQVRVAYDKKEVAERMKAKLVAMLKDDAKALLDKIDVVLNAND